MTTKKDYDEKMILSHIQEIRFNYLKKNIDLTCDYQDSLFIPNQYIESNIEKLSKLVKVNIFDGVNMNLSKKKIDFGAKMFFALNSCPSKIVRLYSRVMYGNKSRIVLMASNIIKQALRNSCELLRTACKLMELHVSSLNFMKVPGTACKLM